jgi:hypothetical protein
MKRIFLVILVVLSLVFLIGSVGAFEVGNIGFGQLFIQSAVCIFVEWIAIKILAK